ncbi:TPA: hypothetical protein ACWV7Q_001596 [Salmonella enterica subsp. enterica serovar Muenchen]|nr:hypothetical protein [Salmonella enterica]HDI1194885.1 hypothetical protein [Salmonella enterica]
MLKVNAGSWRPAILFNHNYSVSGQMAIFAGYRWLIFVHKCREPDIPLFL